MKMTGTLLFTILSAACGNVHDRPGDPDGGLTPDAAPRLNTPGTYTHTLTVGTQEREVIVYVPALAEEAVAPAVFMFHGTSGDGQRFYEISGWKEKADAEGMIVLFPSALVHCFFEDETGDGDYDDAGERKVTTKWSHGQLGEDDGMPLCSAEVIATLSAEQRALVDHPLADDLAFFDAMLALLASDYVVDDKLIYTTGFSNGGQMSARLAVQRSDKLAASAVAGGGLSVVGPASRAISMVFSVGNKDDRFTTAMGVTEIPLTEEELLALPGFAAILNKFLTALQLSDAYTYELVTINGKQAAHLTFSTSTVGANNTFQALVIEDMFHVYPNGTNHPVVAADQLWTFFQTQRLP
jgi:polyhydroxybutyrate depolymerase